MYFVVLEFSPYFVAELHLLYMITYVRNFLSLKLSKYCFQVKVTKEVETDFKGGQELYELTYDTPNEADIFILIHKTQGMLHQNVYCYFY